MFKSGPPSRGNSHINVTGVIVPFRGWNSWFAWYVTPRVLKNRFRPRFSGTFLGIELKNMRWSKCQSTDLMPIRSKKLFVSVPRPQSKTKLWCLVGILFKISDDHPRHFCMGAPRSGSPPYQKVWIRHCFTYEWLSSQRISTVFHLFTDDSPRILPGRVFWKEAV